MLTCMEIRVVTVLLWVSGTWYGVVGTDTDSNYIPHGMICNYSVQSPFSM